MKKMLAAILTLSMVLSMLVLPIATNAEVNYGTGCTSEMILYSEDFATTSKFGSSNVSYDGGVLNTAAIDKTATTVLANYVTVSGGVPTDLLSYYEISEVDIFEADVKFTDTTPSFSIEQTEGKSIGGFRFVKDDDEEKGNLITVTNDEEAYSKKLDTNKWYKIKIIMNYAADKTTIILVDGTDEHVIRTDSDVPAYASTTSKGYKAIFRRIKISYAATTKYTAGAFQMDNMKVSKIVPTGNAVSTMPDITGVTLATSGASNYRKSNKFTGLEAVTGNYILSFDVTTPDIAEVNNPNTQGTVVQVRDTSGDITAFATAANGKLEFLNKSRKYNTGSDHFAGQIYPLSTKAITAGVTFNVKFLVDLTNNKLYSFLNDEYVTEHNSDGITTDTKKPQSIYIQAVSGAPTVTNANIYLLSDTYTDPTELVREVRIDGVTFTDGEGQALTSSIAQGATVKATVAGNNSTISPADVYIIISEYTTDAVPIMLQTNYQKVTADAGADFTDNSVSIEAKAAGSQYKAFVWDGFENIMPLTGFIKFPQE